MFYLIGRIETEGKAKVSSFIPGAEGEVVHFKKIRAPHLHDLTCNASTQEATAGEP